MKTIYKTLLVLSAIIIISLPALAQGGPPATPIDGGLSLLLAAGAALGIKKFRDHK